MIRLMQLTALAIVICGVPVSAAAEPKIDQWTYSDIAHLFPEAPEGWHASSLDLNSADTITSEFESFAGAMLASPVAPSVRLIATRRYSSDEREFEIQFDTENIEVAAQIDAIVAGFATDSALRENLGSEGFGIARLGGFPGISIDTGPESGRVFKIGSAGVVLIECNYMDCGEDMDRILQSMDFTTVEQFIAFDHRRAINEETVGARQ